MGEVIKGVVHLAVVMLGVMLFVEALKHLPVFVVYLLVRLWDLLCSAFSRRRRAYEPLPPTLGAHAPDLPYECKRYLLTVPEKHFFDMLSEALAEDIYICPQVSFGGVLSVTARRWNLFRRYWDKVKAKRIDFLLCDKRTLTPLVAIELDDSSHDSPKRAERDEFVDQACRSAGLPILHFRVQKQYDRKELQDILHPTIHQARISRGVI